MVDAEWEILYDKLTKIAATGARVVLSKLPIGDVATQWFADRYDMDPVFRGVGGLLNALCLFPIQLLKCSLHPLYISDIFCAGRVPDDDLQRTRLACGGAIQSSVNNLTEDMLGSCELFEEKQVGGERYNFFQGCPKAKTCTIIMRGGAAQFIEETERSLHDAIMIVRRAIKNDSVVAGGGAIEVGCGRGAGKEGE